MTPRNSHSFMYSLFMRCSPTVVFLSVNSTFPWTTSNAIHLLSHSHTLSCTCSCGSDAGLLNAWLTTISVGLAWTTAPHLADKPDNYCELHHRKESQSEWGIWTSLSHLGLVFKPNFQADLPGIHFTRSWWPAWVIPRQAIYTRCRQETNQAVHHVIIFAEDG